MSDINSNGLVKNDGHIELTNNILDLVGKNIRLLRKSKNWTQEELAELAAINDKEVSHIEQGNRNITIETLVKIALVFNVEPHTILTELEI